MSVSANFKTRRREKVFGRPRGTPLDRNAKARIIVYARAYNARCRREGQHKGPITRAFMEVLEALLWAFHNCKSGDCFPSYKTIKEQAGCSLDTVRRAIKVLEEAEILTWVHRLVRIRVQGPGDWRSRVIRTSNAYVFRDPLPCSAGRPVGRRPSKTQNHSGTQNQEDSVFCRKFRANVEADHSAAQEPLPTTRDDLLALARERWKAAEREKRGIEMPVSTATG